MEAYSLDGAWRLGAVPQQPLTFEADDRAAVAEWLPARVPGNIYADLMRAGRLPDLYHADNLREAAWVDDQDWWLESEVLLARAPGERAFLCFDGIDYLATIWLDDHCLARHEGAFSRCTIEITDWLPGDGSERRYRVAVRLWGPAAWPRPAWRWWERLLMAPTRWLLPGKASLRPYHPRLRLLRPPMQAGWDFAPKLPALGLWEGARVEISGPVRIEEVAIGSWRGDSVARAPLRLRLEAAQAGRATIRVAWEPHNFAGHGGESRREWTLDRGKNELTFGLEIPSPRLWEPREWGEPHRYILTVTLAAQEGPSTTASLRFGIRTVTVERMRLTVNGRPFFARGVNWVPCDILPGTVPRERYERLLRMARARGVNFIRVWGGGGRERREFYELCDEMGFLLWQEFPFACAFLDHYPRDAEFMAVARQEVEAMVRELRHHPSLALWGAGNEYSYRRNRALVEMLGQIVRENDERPFLPPSPGAEDRHNWQVWHGLAPLRELAEETTPFLSEFGLQALPTRASLASFLPADALWPPNELWTYHHAELGKLRRYMPHEAQPELDDFIWGSQLAQGMAVQLAVERLRRRKAEGAGGIAIWQWNEPWPAISWALVDYFGEPKGAAEGLRLWYHPLLLSLELDWLWEVGTPLRASLWAINDLATPFERCEAQIFQGERRLWAAPLALPAHSARRVADVCLDGITREESVRLELWQDGRHLAYNQYALALPGPARAPLGKKLYRTIAEWIMRYV